MFSPVEQIVLLIRVSSQMNLTLSPAAVIRKGKEGKNGGVMNGANWAVSCF